MSELVFRADAYAKSCDATVTGADERGVTLDRTIFYPTGGGQPGDTGMLRLPDGTSPRVTNAIKGDGRDAVIRVREPGAAAPAVGSKVTATIDWDRRHRHMRMHTCLHLLSAVLPYPVTGGQVAEDKGRLDFDIPEATLDKDAIAA